MIKRVFLVLGISIIVQYLYQLSLVFYNALLAKISSKENYGKISGLGEGFNSFGWMVATIILLPFANGAITLIGNSGRQQVFLPAFLFSILFMLPMLFLFKENGKNNEKRVGRKTLEGMKLLINQDKNVFIFLIAFSLISDIILTLNLYFAVVMDALYKASDSTKSSVFIINIISVIIIGYILGKVGDKIGHKKILMWSCFNLIAMNLIFFLSHSSGLLYFIAIFSGAGVGGYYVVSRSLMIKISPTERLGEYFGFYSTFQRFSSIIAPIVWGAITFILRDKEVFKYNVAGMTMVALLVLGTAIMFLVKEEA